MTKVDIHQLTPKLCTYGKPGPFINVDEGYYHVLVWASVWGSPTYLLRNDTNVALVQFDDEAVANEWLSKNSPFWQEITLLKLLPAPEEEVDPDDEAYL